jgi:hypothetical protein
MRIINVTFKKPANLLISALQQHCRQLIAQPEQNGISSLKDLEDSIWAFAKAQQPLFPRCKLEDLEAISDANILHQFYNLLYKEEKSMITIFARPDAIEKCFRDYDASRGLYKG